MLILETSSSCVTPRGLCPGDAVTVQMAILMTGKAVTHRTKNEGCPFCTSRRVCKHNSLVTQAPDVAATWDNEANASSPDEFTTQSNHRAHWLCPVCKHKWCATIQARVGGSTGCPQCYNKRRSLKRVAHPTFTACKHPLLGDWDYEANAKDSLLPEKVSLRSNKLVHWVCQKCPRGCLHKYQATPCNRTANKSGCPCCSGLKACKCNSLQSLFPDIASEWDHERNEKIPADYSARSAAVVWWRSAKRGSWQQRIYERTTTYRRQSQKQIAEDDKPRSGRTLLPPRVLQTV